MPMQHDVNKSVVIMAPHSSTWDIVIGLSMLLATDLQLKWVGKKNFFGPLGWLLKSWGGVPLDREGTSNFVDAMSKTIKAQNEFHYGIAPAGTRSYTDHWKSGFYHIAIAADVPLIFCFVDFKRKLAGCGPLYRLTGDINKDMKEIRKFFTGR